MKQTGDYLQFIYGTRKLSPSVRARHSECHYLHRRKNVWMNEEKNEKTSDIEMNYMLVTVLLEMGSDGSL